MIVDFHTHIFPPAIIEGRGEWCERDPLFRALYANPKVRLASAEDLVESMDRAGVDAAVILGLAWSSLEICGRHNDYLLDVASRSGGRLVPFCTVQAAAPPEAVLDEIERCARAGAGGLGELRPDDQGYELRGSEASAVLARGAIEHDLILLFHVSEPVGHAYAGKQGLAMADFAAFVEANPRLRVVGAHWGGGLPFFSLMPEMKAALASTWFDTAASRLLYAPAIYGVVSGLLGAERLLFGSDFPLIGQKTALQEVEAAGLGEEAAGAILGGNAARLLGLE